MCLRMLPNTEWKDPSTLLPVLSVGHGADNCHKLQTYKLDSQAHWSLTGEFV